MNVDLRPHEAADVLADARHLPFQDGVFQEVLASHVLEHLDRPLEVMQEVWRVSAPGARCTLRVPHGASDEAWEDPTHVRPYFHHSFLPFAAPYYWRASYGYEGDWQPLHVALLVPRVLAEDPEIIKRVQRDRNVVREVVATLEAHKPARPPARDLLTRPQVEIVAI